MRTARPASPAAGNASAAAEGVREDPGQTARGDVARGMTAILTENRNLAKDSPFSCVIPMSWDGGSGSASCRGQVGIRRAVL